MRAVIQRVTSATLTINNQQYAHINQGVVVLLGIEEADTTIDAEYLAAKIAKLRIFNDNQAVMNLSLCDINGEALVVSQFTLHAQTKKGNRPSYVKAANGQVAKPLYEFFVQELQKLIPKPIQTGVFGADMNINLTNSGPVTIIIDSKNKE